MENIQINERLDALEIKIDLLLEHVNQQRLNSNVIEDLVGDLSIIGKDVYDTTVEELDKRQVEIDPAEVTDLMISFLRNIENFKVVMNTFEMAIDLTKEMGPIANEAIIDFTKKMAVLEQKGYFELIKDFGPVIDNIVKGLTPQDMKDLAENVMLILHTVKDITQPNMLKSIDNAVHMYASIETEDIPSYSIWRLLREMNSPEMKKAFGFAITFMKNMSQNTKQNN